MAACRRGSQTNLVALALYISECQFRTVSSRRAPVKQNHSTTRPQMAGEGGDDLLGGQWGVGVGIGGSVAVEGSEVVPGAPAQGCFPAGVGDVDAAVAGVAGVADDQVAGQFADVELAAFEL